MNVVCPYLVGCFFEFSAGVRRGARGPQVGSALPTHGPLCIYLLEFSFCSDVCLFLLLVAFSADKTAFLCVQDVFQDSEVVERGIVKVVELKKSEIRFFWQKFSWKICGVKWYVPVVIPQFRHNPLMQITVNLFGLSGAHSVGCWRATPGSIAALPRETMPSRAQWVASSRAEWLCGPRPRSRLPRSPRRNYPQLLQTQGQSFFTHSFSYYFSFL